MRKNKPKEIKEQIVMLGLLLQELCTDFDDSPGDKDDRSMDRRVFRRLFGQMCRNCASSRSAATAIVALGLASQAGSSDMLTTSKILRQTLSLT